MFRVAEKEWQAFVEAFTELLTEVDPQIPHLPPKDVIHRIYRDVIPFFNILVGLGFFIFLFFVDAV